MNSEELEQSLRTEFEGSLKNILADMTQEVAQFQKKIDTEIEKHKSHLDDVFQEFSVRIQTQKELDVGFKESVVEHLRLARDEGARITATAIAEAEELTKSEKVEGAEAQPSVSLNDIRDAINDISSQNSQSSILKSLITHAAKFTPRGAFFVVKNQHFVGWRVFGNEDNVEVESITDIVFPLSSTTILGESLSSLGVIESTFGTYADDSAYLNQLGFSEPDSIFAIPLIARGRGVAAIYADNGRGDDKVNLEALETLVCVAGLTVELLAAAQNANYTREPAKPSAFVAAPQTVESSEESERETAVDTEAHADAVEEHTVSDYTEVEPDSVEEVEPDDESYVISDADVVEESESVEDDSDVEEVSFQASDEPEKDDLYSISEESEKGAAYEIVKPIKTVEYSDSGATEYVEEEQSETLTEIPVAVPETTSSDASDIDVGFSVYDDDLIEEVQTQATEEESEGKTEELETAREESEFDTAEPEYDSGIYESAVDDDKNPAISDEFTAPAQHAEFETNQDFNSSPVQFEKPAEIFESTDLPSTEPMSEEVNASDEIEEVSFTEPEASDVNEFSMESFVEEIKQPEALVSPPVLKTRFSDRNLDLPIEVNDDERRLHNDARRFARLLVSEIKLYNEQKVKEGREANDLYDRLREALDRSREMYDKRVQPAVVERFDYFHFEVVNTLADGEESKLGTAYPGAAVAA